MLLPTLFTVVKTDILVEMSAEASIQVVLANALDVCKTVVGAPAVARVVIAVSVVR